MTAPLRWHILGAGAIGSLLAAQLRAAGCDAELLARRGSAPQQRQVVLEQTVEIVADALDRQPPGSIRHLLIATKAHAVAEALQDALPFLQDAAVVVCCANGMGFEEAASDLRPGRPLLRAITTEGAHRSGDRIIHAGRGETLLGDPGGGDRPAWFDASLATVPHWYWSGDIRRALWRKFALNCTINPLTAVYDCRNGELLERAPLRIEMQKLAVETEWALRRLHLWPGGQPLLQSVVEVCRATAENASSMLQDRRAGRRTEIDFLNGHLLRRAAQQGLDLPANARLYAAIVA
jgi:2-dehydropantoate 2-reductase